MTSLHPKCVHFFSGHLPTFFFKFFLKGLFLLCQMGTPFFQQTVQRLGGQICGNDGGIFVTLRCGKSPTMKFITTPFHISAKQQTSQINQMEFYTLELLKDAFQQGSAQLCCTIGLINQKAACGLINEDVYSWMEGE